jgi:FkbM family methyltransferase
MQENNIKEFSWSANLKLRAIIREQYKLRLKISERAQDLRELVALKHFAGFILDGESSLLATGNYPETFIFENIIEYFKRSNNEIFSGAVLDVGAHVGFHALYLSKYFKSILSFEPHPLTYKLLEFNALNSKRKIKTFNFALQDRIGTAWLYDHKLTNIGGSTLVRKKTKPTSRFRVKIKTLDSLNIKERITFIKLDIENSEYKFLKGGRNFISKNMPVIAMEDSITDAGKSDSILFLEEMGYTRFMHVEMQPNGNDRFIKYKLIKLFITRQKFFVKLSPVNFNICAKYSIILCLP